MKLASKLRVDFQDIRGGEKISGLTLRTLDNQVEAGLGDDKPIAALLSLIGRCVHLFKLVLLFGDKSKLFLSLCPSAWLHVGFPIQVLVPLSCL